MCLIQCNSSSDSYWSNILDFHVVAVKRLIPRERYIEREREGEGESTLCYLMQV